MEINLSTTTTSDSEVLFNVAPGGGTFLYSFIGNNWFNLILSLPKIGFYSITMEKGKQPFEEVMFKTKDCVYIVRSQDGRVSVEKKTPLK